MVCPFADQRVEGRQQFVDVVEMQPRGGFVEEEQHVALHGVLGEERRELHALRLAARERRGGLSQLDVTQSHLLQRQQPVDDAPAYGVGLVFAEEGHGVVDGHFQYVVDRTAAVFHFEYLLLEAPAAARLAFEFDVGHELHRDLDDALALTLLAPASRHVERKVRRRHAVVLRIGLVGKEFAYFIVSFDVGNWIRARRLSDRVLVDHFDRFEQLYVAFQRVEVARFDSRVEERAPQCRVEDSLDERRLARAADARDAGHGSQRKAHVDVLQVVLPRPLDDDRMAPPARRRGRFDPPPSGQVVGREAFPAGGKFFRGAAENDLSAVVARFGADVDDPVGRTDHLLLVFNHDDGVADVAQLFEHAHQPVRVARMQADRGFVENVERTDEVAAQRRGQVDALRLAARKRRAQAVERQIAQSHVGEVLQPVDDFGEDAPCGGRIVCVELQFLEEHQQRVDVHRHQIGDRAVAHAHVERFLAQAAAAAFGAARLARVARLHHAELNLAPFAVDVFEEAVQTVEVFVARPQQALLFGRQFVVGRVDREVELVGVLHQLLSFHRRIVSPRQQAMAPS